MTCQPPLFNNNFKVYPKLKQYYEGDVVYYTPNENFISLNDDILESICTNQGDWSPIFLPKLILSTQFLDLISIFDSLYTKADKIGVVCKHPNKLLKGKKRFENVLEVSNVDELKEFHCFCEKTTLLHKNKHGLLLASLLLTVFIVASVIVYRFLPSKKPQTVKKPIPRKKVFDPMQHGILII